ncbi:MAG: class I SAM-dependent methyltransferase [Magnetospirillum sp. WYHS-4]
MGWDEKFSTADYIFGTEPDPFLVAQADRLKPGGRALAVADGEGRNGVWLAGRGLHVLSADASPNALRKAEALAAARGVGIDALCTDLLHWDWPRRAFDLVADVYFHLGPLDRPRLHRAMLEALVPGGLLVLVAFHPSQAGRGTGGPPDPERLYSADLLRGDFAGAEILHLEECEVFSDMRLDSHRPGMAAVTRLLARRRD